MASYQLKLIGQDIKGNFIFKADQANKEALLKQVKKGLTAFDIEPHNPNCLSDIQRRKAYAMIRDISIYEGYPENIKKEQLKNWFCAVTGNKEFSLSNVSKDIATTFISYLVEYCFAYGIPFQFKDLTLTFDTSKQMFLCLKYKRCAVCGAMEGTQIHHVDTVGQGRNRNHLDHRNHRLMCLCWKHHQECHQLGQDTFNERHHIGGIKLNNETILSLGLMSKRQMNEYDEAYREMGVI